MPHMTLPEYLEWRAYGSSAKTLTQKEAYALGISYPLQPGWMHRHATMAINDETLARLKSIVRSKMLSASRREMKARAR